jgi:LacI family transcriptional regulator, galactose operon repressor
LPHQKPPQDTARRRPTLKTIAEISGFAVATVSRALADDAKIALATRKKVAEVAAGLGYVPDRAAQRLRTGKTKVISLILDQHQEILGFGNSLVLGLTQALRGTDYHLNITPHFPDDGIIGPVQRLVRNRLADGVIFSRARPFDERASYLLENKFPFVCHGRTFLSEQHAFVDFDNEAFARMAVEQLVRKGCKHICIILPPEALTFRQHLKYGFMTAVSDAAVRYHIPENIHLDHSADRLRDWAMKLAATPDCPDGFICPGETSCLALRSGFRDAGIPGRDARQFVVKATTSLMQQIDPRIDRIREDIQMAGAALATQLLAQLTHAGAPVQQEIFAPVAEF